MKSVISIVPPYKCIHKHVSMLIVECLNFKYMISNFTLRSNIFDFFSAATDECVPRENEENGEH